jgi:hypothetical protein
MARSISQDRKKDRGKIQQAGKGTKQEKGTGYFSVESLARRMLVALSKDENLFQSFNPFNPIQYCSRFQSFKTFNHCVPFKTSEG